MEYRASLLAGHGFATLALAYYDFDDLPKKFDVIRLEYFEEALCYMLQHTQVLLLSFILLFRTTSRGLSLCTHLCPVHGAALLFFQRLLLETSLVLVPKAPKAPSPFFVRWLDNAEFTVKVT